MNRRGFMAAAATAPLVGGLAPLPARTAAIPTTMAMLDGYNEWLFYERRLLAMEMYPGYERPERWVPMTGVGSGWHFRGDWRKRSNLPQPSTRAALVMQAVGVIDAAGRSWNPDKVAEQEPQGRSREDLLLAYIGFLGFEYQNCAAELRGDSYDPVFVDHEPAQRLFGRAPALGRAPSVLAAVGL